MDSDKIPLDNIHQDFIDNLSGLQAKSHLDSKSILSNPNSSPQERAEALYKLGNFYRYALYEKKKDLPLALSYYKQAVKLSHPRAYLALIKIYVDVNDMPVTKNYSYAITLLNEALTNIDRTVCDGEVLDELLVLVDVLPCLMRLHKKRLLASSDFQTEKH
jgi:tetratricopeptide (TPR) repeat protein